MTMTNSIANRSSLTNIVRSQCAPSVAPPDANVCRAQISFVVRDIESPLVRETISVVFDDLLRLLECLDLIEVHLRKVESAQQTFELFQLIHDDARALVHFIHAEGLRRDLMSEELFDALDGIAFAVSHDLQRVFESNPSISTSEDKTHAIIGKLYRGHDILTNCLQQSTITLALVFNPELEGTKLFNNSDMRFRQSLQLCDELAQLIRFAEASEEDPSKAIFALLSDGIHRFCNESMELLMYSDWPQFESFCERFDAHSDAPQLNTLLHQFRCYLETLLGQVRMRAVLANVFPLGFGDQHFLPASAEFAQPAYEDKSFALAV
jgi:hypothetical protein